MIVLLVYTSGRYEINTYLADWGGRLPFELRVISYEKLFRSRRLPLANYIFTGLERLPPSDMEKAWRYWYALAQSSDKLKLLNPPLAHLHRYELLRILYEQGINDFNVYRLDEARSPHRYPVFVRGEKDH